MAAQTRLKFVLYLVIIGLMGSIGYFILSQKPLPEKINMIITSAAFQYNSSIPSKYTCDGNGINPQLGIQNIPEVAKSLALIVDDPDAPRGTFVHWVLWNINPQTKEIPENSFPQGAVEGLNGSNKTGYIGPCPPSGTHHYLFKLYALDTVFDLSSKTDKAILEKAMDGHILGKAELIGTYSREK